MIKDFQNIFYFVTKSRCILGLRKETSTSSYTNTMNQDIFGNKNENFSCGSSQASSTVLDPW